MLPTFEKSNFSFTEEESVPEHIDDYPRGSGDLTKYRIDGVDTFAHETYPVAIDIDDLPTAQMLRTARMRRLEETQPTSSSGGQGGIQDRAYIISPETH